MAQQHVHQNDAELTGKAGFEALLKASHHVDEREIEQGRIRREGMAQSSGYVIQAGLNCAGAIHRQEASLRRVSLLHPRGELVGEYTAKKMLIKFANTEIVLEPVGTMVLAAKGRADVIGPFGKTPLLLVNRRAPSF